MMNNSKTYTMRINMQHCNSMPNSSFLLEKFQYPDTKCKIPQKKKNDKNETQKGLDLSKLNFRNQK